MYDLYDHITAEPFAPRPILITNFLCYLTNLERRTPSQYSGRYLCIPSVGFVELQAGWRQPVLSKSVSRHATRSEALQPFVLLSLSFSRFQETALLSTAIPYRPCLGPIVASAVVGHRAVVPVPK
jgi:hypothetical protein